MCASVCRKYWFEGYCPKPQGGTNNVLQYMCKAEPLCAENIGLKDIARSCRGELISRGGTNDVLQSVDYCRGGFRGDDLVTCHPLFSDMTLQSQILVIESLFLTSVSKFIRKYSLSRQFSYMYSSCSNPAYFPCQI